MKYAWIDSQRDHPGYCQWRSRVPSARALAYAVLDAHVRQIHAGSHASYGRPWIVQALRRQSMPVGSEQVSPGRHALLILDKAAWHTTLKLPQLPNLSLLTLPAASPELNPAEQVWQQLRDRSLANRCYDNFDQILDACCDPWNKFTQSPAPFVHCVRVAGLV